MNRTPIRPVTIASICSFGNCVEQTLALAEQAAKQHPDLILMPEGWHYSGFPTMEQEAHHPATARLYEIAKEYGVYIVESSMRQEGNRFYNSAIVIDRNGETMAIYNKIYPYWPELKSEENPDGAIPGRLDQPVLDFDFGKAAIFICFDANFPDIWANAANQGAELVLWPSAYGAGRQLEAHALNNHYYIVSATTSGHVMGIDINGERFVNTCSKEPAVQFVTVDLDRCIFHTLRNHNVMCHFQQTISSDNTAVNRGCHTNTAVQTKQKHSFTFFLTHNRIQHTVRVMFHKHFNAKFLFQDFFDRYIFPVMTMWKFN